MSKNTIRESIRILLLRYSVLFLPQLLLQLLRIGSVSYFMLVLFDRGAEDWVVSSVVAANVIGALGISFFYKNIEVSIKESFFIGGVATVVGSVALLVMLSTSSDILALVMVSIYSTASISIVLFNSQLVHQIKRSKYCKYNLTADRDMLEGLIQVVYGLLIFVVLVYVSVESFLYINAAIGIVFGVWKMSVGRCPIRTNSIVGVVVSSRRFSEIIRVHVVAGFLGNLTWQIAVPIVTILAIRDFGLGAFGAQMSGFIFIVANLFGGFLSKWALTLLSSRVILATSGLLSGLILIYLSMVKSPIELFVSYGLFIVLSRIWFITLSGSIYEITDEVKIISKQVSFYQGIGGIVGALGISYSIFLGVSFEYIVFASLAFFVVSLYYVKAIDDVAR